MISSSVFSISRQSTSASATASTSLNPKTNLSSNTITESGQQKKLAVVGSNVYVVWTDNASGHWDTLFKKSIDGGNTFDSTINLSNNAGNSFGPEIAVAGTSTVYVVWDENTPRNSEIFFKKSIDGGNTFDSTINLSNNTGNSFGDPPIIDR